jgi:ATP-dependent protease ClpP protease subunit
MQKTVDSFLSRGEIFLFGDITERSSKRIYQQLCYLQNKQIPINMTICSSGGDVESACAIIDKIQEISQELDVKITVAGKAYSSAALILMSAPTRLAYKNSGIMFHPCSYEMHDYHDQNKKYIEFAEKTYNELMNFVIYQCGLGKNQSKNFIDQSKIGLWLTAEEAKRMKIIHGIIGEQVD